MSKKSLSQRLHQEYMQDPEYAKIHQEFQVEQELALQIVKARSDLGLTQQQLAERIGTSRSTIARIESLDYGKMSLTTLRRIAEVLGMVLEIKFKKVG